MTSAIGNAKRHLCALSALGGLVVAGGCGAQAQPPRFDQAFGTVDSPCSTAAPAVDAVQRCTAHVLVVNNGGAGLGHATMVIELKDAKGGAAPAPVKCGKSIPETPGGGYADLVCAFDLGAGKTIARYPTLQTIDYSAPAAPAAPGFDLGGLGILALAGATALLALATLVATALRRSSPPAAPAAAPAPAARADRPAPAPGVAAGPEPEYSNIPQLPR